MADELDVEDALAERYGREPRSGRRRWPIIALVVFTTVTVVWAAWLAWHPAGGVTWRDAGFSVLDDGQAQVRFVVVKDPERTAVCTLRVTNQGLVDVGRLDVVVGPSGERSVTTTTTVLTSERAADGKVRACALR